MPALRSHPTPHATHHPTQPMQTTRLTPFTRTSQAFNGVKV